METMSEANWVFYVIHYHTVSGDWRDGYRLEVTSPYTGVTLSLGPLECMAVSDVTMTLLDIRRDIGADEFMAALTPLDVERLLRATGKPYDAERMARLLADRDGVPVPRPPRQDEVVATAQSSKDKRRYYTVVRTAQGGWRCTCPGYHYHNGECKHLDAVLGANNGVRLTLTAAGKRVRKALKGSGRKEEGGVWRGNAKASPS